MKKQINPTIKAHLIRGACYVLLLLAVCVIPFALAQRNTTKRSAARPKATAVDKAKLMAARAKTGAPASLTGATRIPQRKPASGLSRAMRATDVPQAPNLGSWNIVANYPFASESVSCSSDGTFGYCVGGFDPNIGPSNSFNQYDPVGDTWTPLSSIPTGFYDAPSVYAANTNSIYVFGGIDTSFVVRDIVQRYDVGTGTWLANGTPMPDPAGRYFAAAAYDSTTGKIYVMGGFDGATFSEQTNNWIYDPVADTWDSVTGAPIPVAMGGAGYSIVGDNIYLAGHWNGGLGSTDHYRYDVLANTWTPMAPVPVNIYRPDAAGIGTNTYLVGGGDPFVAPGRAVKAKGPKVPHPSMRSPATSFNTTYIYDTLADTWSSGPNTNVAHSFTGGTAIGTKLIVVTGFDGVSGDTNIVELADAAGGGGCTTCTDYTLTSGTSTFVAGVDDTGNHTDDGDTPIALPFTVTLYDTTFSAAEVGSNGHLTFGTADPGFGITCSPFGIAGTTYVEAPYWTDQRTDAVGPGCADFPGGVCGIFTTTTGVAPNRIFYIEWRTVYFGSNSDTVNYEIAIHEDCNPPFEYIYNTINPASTGNDSELVVGVKKDDSNFNQFGCDVTGGTSPPVSSGQAITAGCTTGGPSPTPSPSGTPSACTVNGVIDLSDPTQIDRMFRDGVPSLCAAPKVCPGVLGDGLPRHYDSYTFTNTTGSTQCVTIDADAMTCTGNNFIFLQAYLGSFDPNNLCTNYLADGGSSPNPTGSFSFDLDDGQTVVIVVNEVNPDAGCVGYSFTVSGICGGGVSPTPSPTCPPGNPTGAPGPWIAGTSYPTTIVRYGFAQTSTHFYVFGGVDNGAATNAVNRMDLSTGNWEPRAPMPFGNEAPTCALDESAGIVYCADGFGTNQFAAYDIAADSWTPLAPDPFADVHYGSASGALNGKVFVAGGFIFGGASAQVDVYDIASNTWSSGTAAPAVFFLAGYQQIGQFLYVVGGFEPAFTNNATTWRLDLSTGTWDVGPAFTPQRADFGLAYDAGNNKLYALAGDLPNDGNPFNSTNLVDELDLGAWPGGTWNPSPPDLPLPNRQANQAGFYGNGDIWSVGGIDGATFIFTNEVWHRNNGGGVVCPSPTPTPTLTPTPSVPPVTPTPTITPPPVSPTPSVPPVTPTPTPTETPRPTPTPRPRPTPHPRP